MLAQLGAFDERNDLTYFGELTVPGLVPLARRGVINGKYGALHPGKFVAAHIGNSLEDLDYIERNPAFELHSYEHTNDPRSVAAHADMVAMNGALMADFTGQIGLYAFGPQVYTDLGGHLGFAMGAFLAKRGRYVTVLPSTARGGKVSTIVPQFDAGQIVSIPREIADTIVTDQGMARLLGKSVRQRVETMLEVAHPEFRDEIPGAAEDPGRSRLRRSPPAHTPLGFVRAPPPPYPLFRSSVSAADPDIRRPKPCACRRADTGHALADVRILAARRCAAG